MDSRPKPVYSKDLASLRGIKLGALNIRSVVHKVDEIEVMLHQSKLDYLGLCETWLTPDTDTCNPECSGLQCLSTGQKHLQWEKRGWRYIDLLQEKILLQSYEGMGLNHSGCRMVLGTTGPEGHLANIYRMYLQTPRCLS